jgi:hypothetical protein
MQFKFNEKTGLSVEGPDNVVAEILTKLLNPE